MDNGFQVSYQILTKRGLWAFKLKIISYRIGTGLQELFFTLCIEKIMLMTKAKGSGG